MMKSATLLSLSLAALVGCGGDDPKKPPITITPDAPMNTTPDAPTQAACTAPSTIPGGDAGDQLPFDYTADSDTMMAGNQEAWETGFAINQDATPDVMLIGFYEGPAPAYTIQDFAPGNYDLSTGEASASTCSICLQVATDVDQAAQMYADDYWPNMGTVNLTAISAQKITGSLQNVRFRHVNIDQNTLETTDDPSGCTATLGTLSFDVVPTPAMNKEGKMGWQIAIPTKNFRPVAVK